MIPAASAAAVMQSSASNIWSWFKYRSWYCLILRDCAKRSTPLIGSTPFLYLPVRKPEAREPWV